MKLLKNAYKTLPYHTLVKMKCPWLKDMVTSVKARIAEFERLITSESNYDGQPELSDPNFLLDRFRFNYKHNMYFGNFIVLKYFVLMFKIKILYLMIGQWKFTDFDYKLYNYFRSSEVSKWSHQSLKWVLMYNSGKIPSCLPHTADSKWFISYELDGEIKDEFYTNLFKPHFILLDDMLRNLKQLELSYPTQNFFDCPQQFPKIVSVDPVDPVCGPICTVELSFLKGVLCGKKYNLHRDQVLSKQKASDKKQMELNCDEVRAKQKAYREKHKERLATYFHEYGVKNKDKITARRKKYESEHKDELKLKRKIRYAENREENRRRSKEYRDKNREKLNVKSNAYYHSHIDEQKARRKIYRANNKELIKESNRRYRQNNRDQINSRVKSKDDARRAAGYRYRFDPIMRKHRWVYVGNEKEQENNPMSLKEIAKRERAKKYAKEYRKAHKADCVRYAANRKAKIDAGYQRLYNIYTHKKEWVLVFPPIETKVSA